MLLAKMFLSLTSISFSVVITLYPPPPLPPSRHLPTIFLYRIRPKLLPRGQTADFIIVLLPAFLPSSDPLPLSHTKLFAVPFLSGCTVLGLSVLGCSPAWEKPLLFG